VPAQEVDVVTADQESVDGMTPDGRRNYYLHTVASVPLIKNDLNVR